MSDITEIEAEARNYAASHPSQGLPGYRYLVAMLAVIDGLRAEIRRLDEMNHFFKVQYQDEDGINMLIEQLRAARAEIAVFKAAKLQPETPT